ncbi:MAG: GNAT family N-acetyltransferase [Deltaproteobacteria bacterium]|nr:GNAT family N-acetyltransferase [Deltaproteobacteria bacterium]
MEIILASLTLRAWAESDAASLVRHANDPEVAKGLRDRFPQPYTAADAEAWIAFCRSQPVAHSFAIDVGGEAVGSIGIETFSDIHRRTGEIGYWLGREVWGRGIATTAVIAVTQYGFEKLELARVQAGVFEWNLASSRVLEKAGFTREGRLRHHVTKGDVVGDMIMYSRIPSDAAPAPSR